MKNQCKIILQLDNVVDLTIHTFTSFAIATHFRKRSEYRRPSQMGVPNASFQQKQSEFLSHQPQRPKLFKAANQRPSNMLGGSQEGSEASKETFISESKRSYEDRTATALKGAKAQQSRWRLDTAQDRHDSLQLLHSERT